MSTVQPQNVAYKERFPKAAQEMEERLSKFIQENMELTVKVTNDPVTSFVHHQMMEMAKDCLERSQEKLLTSHYFYEMSENLQKLLNESREKSNTATVHLKGLIKKLLIIISRPARLLECLEFNPQEFNKLIETVEEQRNFHGLKIDIPNYIINKLRIVKNPLLDLVCDNGADIFDKDDKDTDDSKNEESDNHVIDISKPPSEDDYEMIKLISNGAYGCVHLVRHKETRQRFAMKKIDKQNLILRNQVEQAFAERDIMSFTDNPFVVSLYCSFDTKRYLCMVMEYVEGGDCATLLKSMGPLPVDLARFYFAETVLAVEYLHSYGIVHRDLKPDNLLITSMGHIKLTDFGLSKIGLMNLATNLYEGYLDKDTKQFNDKQVCGTPEYIAPEVISRQGYGKPVDWWSMGIILYEFLIGCVPFFGETPEELFAHVINDEVCWPDDDDWPLPEEAKHLINQLLQQNPIDRLGTGGAHEVKEHGFFEGLNWDDLLRQKAEFVPQLDNEEDTSYFDTRADRYNHEVGDSEEQDDTDESSSSMFSSFSSCSPKYHRVYSRIEKELAQEKLMKSSSTSSIADEGHSPINRLISPSREGNLIRTQSLNENRDGELQSSIEAPTIDPEIKKEVEEDSKDKEKLCTTPESSQTESEDFSPKSHRKRRQFINIKLASLPKFSISSEIDDTKQAKDESDGSDKGNKSSQSQEETQQKSETPSLPNLPHSPTSRISLATKCQVRGRSVIKSASATGLSLMIPNEETKSKNNLGSSGGSSTSSRDASPNREVNGILNQLKPPIIIRKGPRGFGFTLRAIRVYYGDSDIYTVHHLVLAVDNNSPAFEAGLRPTDLITHINGEPIQGLLHHQVLQLVLSGGDKINIRTTPLENTTIKSGGRKRNPSTSRMTRRPNVVKYRKTPTIKRSDSDKRRRSSLLRRLSSKRASAEIQQLIASGGSSPPLLTPSRSYQSLHRPVSGNESSLTSTPISNNVPRFPRSPPSNRLHFSTSDSSAANSSQSSSPSSSVPNSPASLGHFPHFPRPCTLSGLKHKSVQTFRSPRRKSLGHIPLSPLARTPSPSLLPLNPTSPNRSPCAISFPVGHQPGSSQTTQSFIIQKNPAANAIAFTQTDAITTPLTSVGKSFSRPKSAEPSSPLLGRALSPDRAILNRTSDKSVLTRLKRHSLAGCVSSPLAISSLPPSKGANCKNYSKLIESTDSPENLEEDILDERTIRLDYKEEKCETKSEEKLEAKNDNSSENAANRTTRGSSINIILSKPNEVEKDNDKPSLIPVPSNNTKKKLEGKTSSPINFRKSLFKQNSGKRSRSTSRLKEETQVKK